MAIILIEYTKPNFWALLFISISHGLLTLKQSHQKFLKLLVLSPNLVNSSINLHFLLFTILLYCPTFNTVPLFGALHTRHTYILYYFAKKKVARIITHSPPLSHSKPLFLELHILNIHLIYNYQLACFVFQHINHLLPLPVSSLFQFNYHIHNYSTRHKHDLHILPHKQSFSIRTQGPKCWNALPLSLRQSLRIHNYKKILKKYYLSLINTSDL